MGEKMSGKIVSLILVCVLLTTFFAIEAGNQVHGASSSGCISLTFDDGILSQYTTSFPLLQHYGMVGTFYIPIGAGPIGAIATDGLPYNKVNQIPISGLLQMQAAGDEIGSHSVTHNEFSTMTDAQINYECDQSMLTLESWGLTMTDFAYPYGLGNLTHADTIVSQYYRSARIVGWNPVSLPTSKFEVMGYDAEYILGVGTYAQLLPNLESIVSYALSNHLWVVFLFHDIVPDAQTASKYGGIDKNDFISLLTYIQYTGIQVLTINQALNYGLTPSPTPTPTPTPTPSPSPTGTLTQVPVSSATASSYSGAYTPSQAIDGIASTSNYWGTTASLGLPQWLQLDLGTQTSISQIVTHFYDGDSRVYTYYIQVSTDGSNWNTVVSSKTGSSIVTDTFTQVTCRFVRITVTGDTANTAAHIEQITIYH